MTFGPYPDGHCFYIEKSGTYAANQQNVRMAEFLLLRTTNNRNPTVWIVEAKSSSPQPGNKQDFEKFVNEIREKLINAFSLGWACCLGRHKEAESELPETFKNLDLSQTQARFVVVIKDHQEPWLPAIQEAMTKALHSTIRTWSFGPTPVAVINDAQARDHCLILAEKEADK